MTILLKKEVLKKAIYDRGFTHNEFALYSKISKGYLSQLLNGLRNPSITTVKKILKTLKKGYVRDDLFELK